IASSATSGIIEQSLDPRRSSVVSAKVLDQGIDYQSGSEHPRSIGCRTPPGCVYFSKTMSRYVSSRLMSLLRGYFLMISDQTEKMEQTETTKAHPSVPSFMSFP